MVLGCEQPVTGYHETNFSMAYSSHISWQSADVAGADGGLSVAGVRQPVRESRQPAQPERAGSRDGSGRVASAARSAPATTRKLDEYLTSVRDVEKRAQDMRAAKDKADANAATAVGRWP